MDRPADDLRAVAVMPLGGTIACVPTEGGGVYPSSDRRVMEAVLVEALAAMPKLIEVSIVPELGVPSADLDLAALADVAARAEHLIKDGCTGIVVTTGTDSLEEVAFVLDLMWRHDVPLVVTGAMRNSMLPSSDGPGNLRDAVLVASHDQARGLGVLVVMSGEVHYAWQVQKTHTGLVSAFCSPNGGSTGQVQEDTVRLYSCSVIDRPVIDRPSTGVQRPGPDAPVAVIKAALGDDGRTISHLNELGFCGAVLEVMGGGSVPRVWVQHLDRLAREMPVVYSSRTGAGPTLLATYGGVGGELSLQKLGAVPAGLLTPLKARLLLQLLLRRGCDGSQISSAFDMFNEPQTTSRRPLY